MQTEVRESERLLDLDDLDWLPIAGPDLEHARATALRRPRVYDLRYSVGDYVDRHARQRPRDIAVRDERFRLSYEELAERTRECAIALRKAVEADSRIIAVSGPLGAHTAVAFLGIERIGAIYLPVDETWPRLRIESLLVRSGAAAIAWTGSAPASEALRGAATACNIPMVSMEDASAQGVGWSYPATLADPATLRYVLYTSGSTGQPKGAVVEHQGMMNHLHAKVEDLGLTADDVVAQTAPMSFDISVWQMLAALIVGGQTYFVADEDTYLPERLIDCVAKQGITILELVPTVIRLIVEELERSARPAFATLRYLLATGEALPSSTARRWLRAVPQVPLVNAYGPTECSDDVTHHFVTEASANAHNIPIGRPISNASLFVLAYEGDRLRACNDAEPGELFASGVCVGRGYLGDPAKTRAAFFRDPFLETPTGRVYRTGDLVRRLDSGELEYLGRVDRQVKVSGVRIELGEIEETIRSYDAVSAVAVVIVRRSNGDGTEEPKLVACVSPADVPITTLHSYLRARLPAAMVPHEFVCLASLPLTDNGKIDYGSLVHRASTSRMQGEESVGVMLTHAALCARLAEGRPSVESAGEVGLLARLASGETFVLGDADYDVRTELSADSSFTARWRPNERMYVLDAFGEPVPIGVPGDLYLGGPTIPQGFLNDPRSTAERFVPDRFGGSGARLYRTNTKARVCAEGTIEIIQIEEEGDEGKRRYEPPVGATESALASIWCELLKLERVGRHDNFFELGGHSLLAIRLLSRIRHRLAMQASLTVLFTSPTLSGFAQVLVSSARTTTAPLVLIDRNQPLPLSFAQQRLWFLAQLEGGSEAYHISLGVRLQGVLD
ncbi:MAG: amino acid adenylation domain-containing protein, partial [Candidatus Cybelea sp.]